MVTYNANLTDRMRGRPGTPNSDCGDNETARHNEYPCISWTGGSRKVPVMIFHAEAILTKELSLCAVGERYHLSYKMVRTDSRLVRNILGAHGFQEVPANNNDFNIMWTGSHVKPHIINSLTSFQKVNHFPRSYELTRKDRLYRNLQRIQQIHGIRHFNFLPQTYLLPSEYQDFCTAFSRDRGLWIVKPAASSRGRGVYVINSPSQITHEDNTLVSRYVSNPLLIDGFKFDVRLYVLITSYDPLVIYLYEEGLTRFATVRYEQISKNFKNQFMHLTNYSVNKKSGDYVRCDDPEVEDYGNKWSMSAMLRYLKEDGIDTAALMSQVEDLIIKTIISGEHTIAAACNSLIAHRGNCFELYGFDVLIDKNLKPWLLEVNLSPSLACDSPLDLKVKASVISDMLSLVGVECHDPQRFRRGGSAPVERNKRTQKNTRQRLLSASDVNTALQAGNRIIVKRTSCTLGLSIEEMKVLHRIQDEAERRGGFVRIFPRKDTWQLYGSFLEYKTSLNCMLAKHLFLDRPQMTGSCERLYEDLTKPNVAQYERKLVSLHVRRSRQRKLASKTATGSPYDKECEQKDNGEEEEEEMAKDDEPDVVPEPLTPATDCSTDAVFKPSHNLLAALQKDANLSKVQARLAFSSYLQRVQSRLQSELDPSRLRPNEEEQMELVIRFLRRAAGNLQRTLHVNHPCTTIPVIERRRLLAKQLREFIHLYNEETQHLMSCEEAADSKVQTINHKDFQAFIAEANECDLEEILTFYTQKNKSASVFLGTQNSASLRATKERQGGARDCKTQMDGVALCSDAQQRLVGQAHGPEIPKASCVSQPSSSAVTVIPEHCAPRADSSKPFANGHSIGRYLQPTSCTGLTTESAGSSLSDPRSHSNSLGTFSSFQSAAQIYSQRLSRPSSTRSAGSRHSVLRTRCHSAHAGKEPENPYNEREVTASLQRLAERQSIQQQSGHLKTITQQLAHMNLLSGTLGWVGLRLPARRSPMRAGHSNPDTLKCRVTDVPSSHCAQNKDLESNLNIHIQRAAPHHQAPPIATDAAHPSIAQPLLDQTDARQSHSCQIRPAPPSSHSQNSLRKMSAPHLVRVCDRQQMANREICAHVADATDPAQIIFARFRPPTPPPRSTSKWHKKSHQQIGSL